MKSHQLNLKDFSVQHLFERNYTQIKLLGNNVKQEVFINCIVSMECSWLLLCWIYFLILFLVYILFMILIAMGKFGMGKVSALREVAMCIEGGYKYYGLGMSSNCLVVIVGLFAFGCEKLRYKAEIQPSELLDPVHPFNLKTNDSSDHIYGTPSKNTNPISIKENDMSRSTHQDNPSSNLPWTQIKSFSCISPERLHMIPISTAQRQDYSR